MTTVLEKTLSFLAPYDCFLCSNEGNIVCAPCSEELLDEAFCCCHVCGLPSLDRSPCDGCRSKTDIDALFVVGPYDGMLRRIISDLKFRGARQVSRDTAPLIAGILPVFAEPLAIVHLPTSTRRVRQRGFDQASLLADALADLVESERLHVLERRGHTRQTGADAAARKENVKKIFHLRNPTSVKGKIVLLVDDVVTTGASMEAAAALLRRAGARHVLAAAIARNKLAG